MPKLEPVPSHDDIPRRRFVVDGLATLAAALAIPASGCGDDDAAADAGDDTSEADARPPDVAAPRDAGDDAGPTVFAPRELPPAPALRSRMGELGPLGEPNADGVRMPAGFTARIIARSGAPVLRADASETGYEWHHAPDGGATYRTSDGGWIYVSNCELPLAGGVGAIRFDAAGDLVSAQRLLRETNMNCAGGPTPWHTWLSCEEWPDGRVVEIDPWGEQRPAVRHALGHFRHEAAAIDPMSGHLYLTEDEDDGRLYRFVPSGMTLFGTPDLTSGVLQVAQVEADGRVQWHEVPDPLFTGDVPTRMQVAASTAFDGGEGIWYHNGFVYFSTKGDNRVWSYDVNAASLTILYDAAEYDPAPLVGVDAVIVTCCGDVLVAEDAGAMQIVTVLPSGEPVPTMQIVGHDLSEVTGIAFDPSGTRLYFSSQRGSSGTGITYEMVGPFHEPA